VLAAEDEPMVWRLICSVLKERGYTVLEAEDGLAASRLAEQYNGPIHLLITDVVMPAMSGQELTKRVKASRPGTKILYISGYTEEAISRFGALDEGAFFLEKPFTPDSLARKIREILGTG
jgi:two-component system cell cycle sensor histidine kinase/response regulator CckA